MNYGFHSKNGLFFQRDEEGNVIVRKVTGGRVMFKETLDANSWASVICSVSSRGENADNFQIAKSFHMGGPPLFASNRR